MYCHGVQRQKNHGKLYLSIVISYLSQFIFLQLDCGIHPGLQGLDALPFVDLIEANEIDLLLITQ